MAKGDTIKGKKKSENRKKKRSLLGGPRSLRRVSVMLILLIGAALGGMIFFVGYGVQQNSRLTHNYIKDTAQLYVEHINRDITQINNELIFFLNAGEKLGKLPDEMNSKEGQYYPMMREITEQNLMLKLRYEEVQTFFVYGRKADVLFLDRGTVFHHSQRSPLQTAICSFLQEKAQEDSLSTQWEMINDGEKTYIISWYARHDKIMGCIIDINTIFQMLQKWVKTYKIIPYFIDAEGNLLFPDDLEEADRSMVAEGMNTEEILSYQMGSVGMIHLYILPGQGVLEYLLNIQTIFAVLVIVTVIMAMIFGYGYYRRILSPMESFVASLTSLEEDQMLNENGQNNLMELEAASDKFRELLRKIRSLKIAIYEAELEKQAAELEYMQEQIRPHFFLNCLSLIHGIADSRNESDITHITEILSEYMRHIFREAGTLRPLREELLQVNAYVELQKVRYGDDAFSYLELLEEDVEREMLPPLLLQTLVENSIIHGVTLDKLIEISVYITKEHYEDGDYLYLSVSDTGNGFSEEALLALQNNTPIFYNGRNHVGLKNLRRRLELIYGGKASISFMNMDDAFGAVVEVHIPL